MTYTINMRYRWQQDTSSPSGFPQGRSVARGGFYRGGDGSCIDDMGGPSTFGTIGGGQNNMVCGNTNHSTVSGGCMNIIGSNCAYIGGGSGNCILSDYSSITGGTGNCIPTGFPNAHIIGCNIDLVSGSVGNPNSLHINGLWANGIPSYPTGFPYVSGTVFSAPIGVTPTSGSLLYIM